MRLPLVSLFSACYLLVVSATPTVDQQQVVFIEHNAAAPPTQRVSGSYKHGAFNLYERDRLIQLSPTEEHWMNEEQIFDLIRSGKKFIDVTDGDLENIPKDFSHMRVELPKGPIFQNIVTPLAGNVSISSMKNFLTKFSGFNTRYYQSQTGKQSGEWLFSELSNIAKGASDSVKISVKQFQHSWPQSSTIVRLEAASSERSEDEPIVIIGAHQDSVNQNNPWFGRSPGADDDGSGATCVFETFRVLVGNGFIPDRPIEFHWYSAEEGGLLGSQKVAAAYRTQDVRVVGMFQMDMTGYLPPKKTEVVGIATDFIDKGLSAYLQKLADEYVQIKWVDTQCGYGCSDHASWTKAGYPSAFTFESLFDDHSPYIHSPNDDISHISFEHMSHFVRLAIAFGVELSLSN